MTRTQIPTADQHHNYVMSKLRATEEALEVERIQVVRALNAAKYTAVLGVGGHLVAHLKSLSEELAHELVGKGYAVRFTLTGVEVSF